MFMLEHGSAIMKGATRKKCSPWIKLLVMLVSCIGWISQSQAVSILEKLDIGSLPGDKIELKLTFKDTVPDPKPYQIDSPARISIDLPETRSALETKYHPLGSGNARSATVVSNKDRTRVVINLTTLTEHDIHTEGNILYVTVGGASAKQKKQVQKAESIGARSVSSVEDNSADGIVDIDFRRGENGEGQVIIKLSDPSVAVDLTERSGNIVAEFVDAPLPEELRRRLDVIDFATPVKYIVASQSNGNTEISIEPDGFYEYLAYQSDNIFTVSVKPLTKSQLEKRKKDLFTYSGEKLSLNFQDIEVRSVLQLIADFTELNLVASDTVSGRITLRLQNVPWDQALDLILKTKGLAKRKVGNVLLVAPADEIAAREKLELEANRQVQELAPLRTEFMQVNYAKAADIQGLLTEDSGFLTSRGTVSVDERTNTLMVQDTSQKLEDIRELLRELDVPVQQVLIESRIVIARKDASKELGVQWGITGSAYDSGGDNSSLTWVAGNRNSLVNAVDGIATDGVVPIGPETLAVDLGVTGNGASRFALGLGDISRGRLLDLELSALESSGMASVVSTPKVLTADQQTARISSGTEIPFQEASSSGATATAFKEAVLSLEVTPQITPDGRIIMQLRVNQDSVSEVTVAGIPAIDTNEIETSVVVDDGQTVVLGGVFKTDEVESITKTPFLGDLPIIGRLFKKTVRTTDKNELLIFITPKVVQGLMSN